MIPLAAITDEFSPDIDVALAAMSELGMTGAELRVISGRNIMQLSDMEIDRVRGAVEQHRMRVISIASPLLKCVLPDAPPTDSRFQQDIFLSTYTYADQPRLTRRAFEIAERTGAGIIRVFSYWRTTDPEQCFDRVVSALRALAEEASTRGVIIGIENEAACHIGTGVETARVLAVVNHPSLKAVWDPANATLLGEVPFPDGYAAIPSSEIIHVHAKDCIVHGQVPEWGVIGEMGVDWVGQIDALVRDGYRGWISLETHWKGPNGDKFEASTICGRRLGELVRAAQDRALNHGAHGGQPSKTS